MSLTACIYHANGRRVTVRKDNFDRKASFYCQYDGCNAPMHIVSPYNSSEHFSSYRKSDHMFPYCVRQDLNFNPAIYDESRFHIADFFRALIHSDIDEADEDSHLGSGNGSSHNSLIAIRTLKTLYSAMLHIGINGSYGDMSVNDYLCCFENYNRYQRGFTGSKIVELTYARKVHGTGIRDIEFNYPFRDQNHHTKVLIRFKIEKDFWNVYNHYRKMIDNNSELNPIIIAGIWRASNNPEYIAECDINSSKQHIYVQ